MELRVKPVYTKHFLITGAKTAWNNLREELESRNYIDYNNPNLTYCFTWDFMTYLKLLRAKRPFVVQATASSGDIMGSIVFDRAVFKTGVKYLTRFYNNADRVVTISKFAKTCLIEMGVNKPISVVSCGVNLNKFRFSRKKREEFRKEYKLTNFTVLMVGDTIPRKGLKTFYELARRMPYITFLWVGGHFLLGKGRLELRRLKKNKPSNLLLPGYVNDVVSVYCGADAFCFPSRAENEGLPLLEAWACKLPVITSNIPPFLEKITHNKNGIIAKELNEYERAIIELMNNNSKRKRLIRNGYKEVQDYDIRKTSKQMIDVFRETLNNQR